MKEHYRIADLDVLLDPHFEPLLSRSKAYRCGISAEMYPNVSMSQSQHDDWKAHYNEAEDPLLEYMITGSNFYTYLIEKSGLLLHASAVEMDGEAYLFSANSGTGKSTHTALWLKNFGDRACIINDDKPAIRLLEDGVFVYGTPWSGKSDLNLNRKVPLRGICFLERGATNEIESLAPSEAITRIFEQTVRPKERRLATLLLSHMDRLLRTVPIWKLRCNMEDEAAHISYSAMSKGELK